MAGTIVEWVAFFLFILLFVGSIIAEIKWLVRKGWTTSGRAIGFVMTTDMLSFGIAGIIALVAIFGMFVMVMGPAGRGSDIPESAYFAVIAATVITVPGIFLFLKRIFLTIFKIGTGKSLWLYSLVTSIIILVVVLVPPPLLLYLVVTLWKL